MNIDEIADQWELIDDLFAQAMEVAPNERRAFCQKACADNEALFTLIWELIQSDNKSDQRIKSSIAQIAQEATDDDLLTGQRIDAYQIVKLLARGGMGEVYLASRADGEFEKTVAIKVVRQRLNSDSVLSLFRAERQVLANLAHPYIPALLDAGQLSDGRPYLVTEFVDGIPIDNYCFENRLSKLNRLRLMERVCDAVRHAHSKLVLHLDIKPNNILIEHDGTPRLLDFGVSRLMGDVSVNSGVSALTPEYASPEQVQGQTPTTACDVYSLGVLLYRLFHYTDLIVSSDGNLLPVSPTSSDSNANLPKVDRHNRMVDKELHAVMTKAVAQDAAKRYQSVEEMQADLTRYRLNRPVSVLASSGFYRLRKFLRRNTIAAALTVGVLMLALVLSVRETQLRQRAQIAQANSQRDANIAQEVSKFLVGLFEVADPAHGRGSEISAVELLRQGSARIDTEITGDSAIKANLLSTLAQVHIRLGLYENAEAMLLNALDVLRHSEQQDKLLYATVLTEYGDLLTIVDRYDEADNMLTEALAIRQSGLPANDPAIGLTWTRLGVLRQNQGQYVLAADLLEKSIALFDHLGDTNAQLISQHAQALFELATVRYEQRRNPESLELARRSMRMLQDQFGADHASSVNSRRLIAATLVRFGQFDEAEPMLRSVLDTQIKLYGANHPLISIVYNELASIYHSQGNFGQALEYYDKSLRVDSQAFDSSNASTARAINNKAWAYADMEDYAQAENLFRASLAMRLELFGERHPYTARGRLNLGMLCIKMGHLDEARQLLTAAEVFYQLSNPPDEPRAAKVWHRFGQLHYKLSEFETAAKYYARALGVFESMTEVSESTIAPLFYDMAVLEIDQGNIGRAVQLLEQARDRQATSLPADHPHLARTQALLGEAYLREGLPRGGELVKSALVTMENAFSDESPSIKRGRDALQMLAAN